MPRKKQFYQIKIFGKGIKINRNTTQNIFALVFIVSGLVLSLSLATAFGIISEGEILFLIRDFLFNAFAGFAFFVPILFFVISAHFLSSEKLKIVKWNFTLGFFLIFLSLLGLTKSGEYGYFLYDNIAYAFSSIGAIIILTACLISGLILFFDLSLSEAFVVILSLFKFLGKIFSFIFQVFLNIKEAFSEKISTSEVKNDKEDKLSHTEEFKVNAPVIVSDEKDNDITSEIEVKAKNISKAERSMIKKLPVGSKSDTYVFPPLSLLEDVDQKDADRGDVKKNAQIIEQTLESFGIRAKVVEVNYGPSVTQYAIKITMGTKLSKITSLASDLALNLAAPRGQVRIEAPIPGKSLVGIEIPNIRPQIVTLKQVLAHPVMKKNSDPTLVPLGLDVSGQIQVYPISRMPHVLIAGATGSGKSVLLNAWICTFLMRTSPDELRFILVDPKRVELTPYSGVPHLLTDVIVEPEQVVAALRWTVNEMNRRYKMLSKLHIRNIDDYNSLKDVEKMPYIIFVIDELADLMLFAPNDVEELITRLAQMARAVGIHLVLATQRPSVDVITGLMKANIPTRVAFNVSSNVDSRVIIDTPGAEKLLGRGDMLFLPPDQPKPHRIQGPFISSREVRKITEFLKAQNPVTDYVEDITSGSEDFVPSSRKSGSIDIDGKDVLFDKAVEIIMQQDKASASLLQRRLSIGYARAARILDQLEKAGYVGPAEGSKPREVIKRRIVEERL